MPWAAVPRTEKLAIRGSKDGLGPLWSRPMRNEPILVLGTLWTKKRTMPSWTLVVIETVEPAYKMMKSQRLIAKTDSRA